MFQDATRAEIDKVMNQAAIAAKTYRYVSLKKRKYLLHAIASGLENHTHDLVETAMKETHLPEARLKGEVARTVLQLRQYGDTCSRGDWMNIRINTIGFQNVNTDLRKMQVPLGPVVVFGSSNFPFAYSTAGGDTACALAAGCPVIVKAHPAHAETSQMVALVIQKAVKEQELPEGVFSHVHGVSFEVGELLVKHNLTKAVAFTGSYMGGKQLFDWGVQRREPIPVFSEMGSTNPVFLLNEKLESGASEIAHQLAISITNNAGQFCTKPGLIVGLEGKALTSFEVLLKNEIRKIAPQLMLHNGIAATYEKLRNEAKSQEGVAELASSSVQNDIHEGEPFVGTVDAERFIKNTLLHREVFGPFSLIVRCKNFEEMVQVAQSIDGKLTATIYGNENEIAQRAELVDTLREICGRFILNGVPTGVTVCRAMHHGGPFPATTDGRFTSVGADGIQRFTRPVCYQNWPDSLLPDELKKDNPLGIWRMINDELTKD